MGSVYCLYQGQLNANTARFRGLPLVGINVDAVCHVRDEL